jgi:hypothetical protein
MSLTEAASLSRPADAPFLLEGAFDARSQPWWDLYVPATCGDAPRVRATVSAVVREAAPQERGDAHAVAARAFLVLGDLRRAARHATAAQALGGEEAAALATFLSDDGARWARVRQRVARGRGARADACCDAAALAWQRTDLPAAITAASRALAICPTHAEASRWARVLVDAMRGQPMSALDRLALLPLRENGFVCPERFRRRVLGGYGSLEEAPGDSGLRMLLDSGVSEHFFALPEEHALLPADHPLVGLEVRADRLRSLVAEGRDTGRDAVRLWEEALALDEVALEDAGAMLAALATCAPGLQGIAWRVADRAVRDGWSEPLLWLGYRARHGARLGHDTSEDSRSVLAERGASVLAVQLALEALSRISGATVAQRAASAQRGRPDLARELAALDRGEVLPALALVTPRLLPRGGAGGAH